MWRRPAHWPAALSSVKGLAEAVILPGLLQVQFLLDRFPALKPSHIIVRDSRQYPSQLQAALHCVGREGFDIVLDAVAGEFFQASYNAMARGGRHIVFGAGNWTPTGELKHCISPGPEILINSGM